MNRIEAIKQKISAGSYRLSTRQIIVGMLAQYHRELDELLARKWQPGDRERKRELVEAIRIYQGRMP